MISIDGNDFVIDKITKATVYSFVIKPDKLFICVNWFVFLKTFILYCVFLLLVLKNILHFYNSCIFINMYVH